MEIKFSTQNWNQKSYIYRRAAFIYIIDNGWILRKSTVLQSPLLNIQFPIICWTRPDRSIIENE